MNSFRYPLHPASLVSDAPWQVDLPACFDRFVHSPWTLLVCKLVIGIVSAYDIHLTIKYANSLPSLELNPVGRWIMGLDQGPECDLQQIASFITAKFVGNIITISVIGFLATWKPRIGSAVAVSVASLQLLLLYFLMFGGK